MGERAAWVVEIPKRQWPGGRLVSMNDIRGHTRTTSHTTAPWRELGHYLGLRWIRAGQLDHLRSPIRLWVEVRQPTDHRRDTPNVMPAIKALVDGVVDAGVLVDDRDGVLEGPLIRRTYPNGPARLRLIFEQLQPGELGVPYEIADQ